MKKHVSKTLSQEEQTILANIKSLADEIMSSSSSSPSEDQKQAEENPIIKADDEMKDEKDDVEKTKNEDIDDMDDKGEKVKVSKAETTTPSDSATANDDAEARIVDVLSTLTEESVDAVAKAIQKIQKARSRNVAKSESPALVSALVELTRVVKDISSRQVETENAFGNLLEGLGVTKQIESEINKEKSVNRKGPIFDQDNSLLAKSLGDLISTMKGNSVQKNIRTDNSSIVQKNLETAVQSLIQAK